MKPQTITLTCFDKPRTVPIKKLVSICGVPGFAVHRSVEWVEGWVVSHIASGLRCSQYIQPTQKLAIKDASDSINQKAKDENIKPAQAIERAIRKAKRKSSSSKKGKK